MAPIRCGESEENVVVTREVEDCREIDLEELLGDRPGTLIVEPPPCAVGEKAPAEIAGCEIVDPAQIAQHLGGWRRLFAVLAGAAVERAQPALGLDDREAEPVALPVLGKAVGPVLRGHVREQQTVRHVLPAGCAQILLLQACRPAEPLEDRPDQIVFGLTLVGGNRRLESHRRSSAVRLRDRRAQRRRSRANPSLGNGVAQEIVGEEAALESGVEAHAPVIHDLVQRFSMTQ